MSIIRWTCMIIVILEKHDCVSVESPNPKSSVAISGNCLVKKRRNQHIFPSSRLGTRFDDFHLVLVCTKDRLVLVCNTRLLRRMIGSISSGVVWLAQSPVGSYEWHNPQRGRMIGTISCGVVWLAQSPVGPLHIFFNLLLSFRYLFGVVDEQRPNSAGEIA